MLAVSPGVERQGITPSPSANVVVKPTGAGKRKGQNPVRQIIGDQIPLDLSLRPSSGDKQSKKVILSVPQYKQVSQGPELPASHLTTPSQPTNELTITPVVKDEAHALDSNCNEMSMRSSMMQRLLASHPQSLLALQQASIILQEHNIQAVESFETIDKLLKNILPFQLKILGARKQNFEWSGCLLRSHT